VFGGAISKGSDLYVNYLLPGILLITIASSISYTAFRLFMDMKSGIFERFQSMPIARSSVLWAHVLTSLVASLISVVVVVGVALLMGFRSGAGVLAWLAVAGILILFTLALTWLAVIAGLSATSVDGAGVLLPADLPAVHQLGIRRHRNHARPGARLRREPAGDAHRQHDPRPVRAAARQHRHLDRPCLVCRHPHRRLHPRHGHLPPQDRLRM
jgi:ABC-2 type transporter